MHLLYLTTNFAAIFPGLVSSFPARGGAGQPAAAGGSAQSAPAVVVEQTPGAGGDHLQSAGSIHAGFAAQNAVSDGLINLEPLPSPDYPYTYDDHENLNDFFDDYLQNI